MQVLHLVTTKVFLRPQRPICSCIMLSIVFPAIQMGSLALGIAAHLQGISLTVVDLLCRPIRHLSRSRKAKYKILLSTAITLGERSLYSHAGSLRNYGMK